MESFVHLRRGVTPRRVHADLDGLKDDELGRNGFTGRTAHLYRRNDPTEYRSAGPLRPIDAQCADLTPTDAEDPRGEPMLLFHNDDCRISLSRRTTQMPFHLRHIDGDLLIFVHEGNGVFETEMGPLDYRPGDWVYLPKALTYRQIPDNQSYLFMIEATEEFRVPPAGTLGRHFPFDPAQATIPEPAPVDDDGREEYEVRLVHHGGPSSIFYRHNPIDVVGWRGDNVPFTFNIADYTSIGSESVHLPPTVHLFMQATGVYVMNFLPRRAETVAGTERTPWYHRNVDFDEVAFFHGGAITGVDMPPGLLAHAPQGMHHGAPEKARERARRRFDVDERIEWKVISIDTRRRLTPSEALLAHAN
ncbi:homogentisate 1,2-dioxygenase [Gordonia sp. CPCC 205333]|uniref:homogentisate 1,2-dioxygenase n=1 Tax=Gordonia sp. CPCC 205333 TaxID=3140790 RepID=UPI003AF397F7